MEKLSSYLILCILDLLDNYLQHIRIGYPFSTKMVITVDVVCYNQECGAL